MSAAATPSPCSDVAPFVLAAMVIIVWGAYVLMTRYQGDPVGFDMMSAGPAGAIGVIGAVKKITGTTRRRDGAS